MTVFLVRTKVVKAAFADEVYGAKLAAAKSLAEFQTVLVEFCRKHGYRVKEVAA